MLENSFQEKNWLDVRQILMSDSGWLKQQQNPYKARTRRTSRSKGQKQMQNIQSPGKYKKAEKAYKYLCQ